MTEIGYAALGIIPSFDGFQAKLEQGSGKALVAAGTSGGAKFGDSAGKSAGKRFGMSFKKVATGLLTGYAAIKVKDFLGDSIAEARESQKVGAITTQVIKSTGDAAKVTAKQVGDLSGALSTKTGIDDEVIQRGANMLLTFKGIRNEAGKGNKIFSRSTAVITDMAAAMAGGKGGDLDLKASAIQVGKALNDPVKGVTALQKVGVSFTNTQRAQIKALVEGGTANAAVAMGLVDSTTTFNNLLKQNKGDVNAVVDTLTQKLNPAQKKTFDYYEAGGHTLEAQKRILKELNSEFGGTAAAQATAGEKVAVAWGNIKEGIGTALLPMVDDLENAFLKKGIPAAQKFTDWLQKKGVPALQNFADDAKPLAKSILPAISDALGTTKDAVKVIAPKLKSVFDGFNSLPDWVKSTIVLGAGSAVLAKKLGVIGGPKGGLIGSALGAFTKGGVQKVFVVNNWGGPGSDIPGGLPKDGKIPKGPASKFGKFALGFGIPATVAAATGIALEKGHPLSGMPPIAGAAAKAITGLVEKQKVDDVTASVLRQNDAWSKVRNNLENGTTKAQILANEITGVRREVDKVTNPRHIVKMEAPNLLNLLDETRRYGSMLDGLDGRVVRTFLTTVIRHQSGVGGTTDSGESIGKHSPTTTQRTATGGVSVNIGTVVAHDYQDFMTQAQRRARRAALDGIGRGSR